LSKVKSHARVNEAIDSELTNQTKEGLMNGKLLWCSQMLILNEKGQFCLAKRSYVLHSKEHMDCPGGQKLFLLFVPRSWHYQIH